MVTDGSGDLSLLIAEDQALVRQGIVALLADFAKHTHEVDNGEEAFQALKAGSYDLALLDIGLPRRTGLDVLHKLRQRDSHTKVIILTGDTDKYSAKQVYAAGADGFLYKTADASHFLETCEAVMRGEEPSKQAASNNAEVREVGALREKLSDRELQVVKLIVEGLSNKAAAEVLFISEHTVRKHREHVNQKLSIRSPLALASFAIKVGLV